MADLQQFYYSHMVSSPEYKAIKREVRTKFRRHMRAMQQKQKHQNSNKDKAQVAFPVADTETSEVSSEVVDGGENKRCSADTVTSGIALPIAGLRSSTSDLMSSTCPSLTISSTGVDSVNSSGVVTDSASVGSSAPVFGEKHDDEPMVLDDSVGNNTTIGGNSTTFVDSDDYSDCGNDRGTNSVEADFNL